MQTIKKLLFLLTPRERKQAFLLLMMIIFMACLDMLGVASILPFIAVLTNPDIISSNIILNKMYQTSKLFGVSNSNQFLFFLGILLFILLIISLSFKALTTYAQVRFVQMREYSIGKKLVEGYLSQQYDWFLNRNSADLGKTILSEVKEVIEYGISPLMELLAKGMVAIALIILLVLVDPKLAIIVGFSLSSSYAIVFYLIKNYLSRSGEERLENNKLRFTVISEAFGAIKEVKVGGFEDIYITNFSKPAQIFAKTSASSQVISILPRFILEAIAFGGVLLIMLYIMSKTNSIEYTLPIITLYVFAGYRLMPALQTIYISLTQLTFIGPSIDKLYSDFTKLFPLKENLDKNTIILNREIELENINFNYPNSPKQTLKNINLIIPAKSKVGLIGTTGSGKTTLVDVILGLLEPQQGELRIDNKIISKKNLRSWQCSIGYVPQNIYLSDDTIAANIAFGIKSDEINLKIVEKVSKIANIHDFIIDELPKQYLTTIGERGIRLSGGQRQRLGIARALYHSPQLLILDEATSALDNDTEQAVMEAVSNLGNDITIILIAHRLNTLKNCDIIFKLDKGKIVGRGMYEDLVN